MGSIDIIKPLPTVLSSGVNKSQQHQEKKSWERRESNLGPLGEKQECYLRALQPHNCPLVSLYCKWRQEQVFKVSLLFD